MDRAQPRLRQVAAAEVMRLRDSGMSKPTHPKSTNGSLASSARSTTTSTTACSRSPSSKADWSGSPKELPIGTPEDYLFALSRGCTDLEP